MESKIKKSIRQNKNDTKTTQNNWHDTCIKIWRGALSKIVSFVLHHPSKVFPSDASHASELNYPLKYDCIEHEFRPLALRELSK